jgi:hypothetical protein
MKANFLKASKISELLSNIENNLDIYRRGSFDYLLTDPTCYFETDLEIDEHKLLQINCEKDDLKEVDNCIYIFEAIKNLSHYLARDERFWVYLTHTLLLSYSRKRWPIPEDDQKAIKHIKNHFFCVGARGIERDNAASRLWWLASICSRAKGLPFDQALTCFLHQSDVRASLVERPTTAQNINVFSAILQKLNDSFVADKKLFERDVFRSLMKELNLAGGIRLLATLPEITVNQILDDCVLKASQ